MIPVKPYKKVFYFINPEDGCETFSSSHYWRTNLANSYSIQTIQALVQSQTIGKYRGSLRSTYTPFKTAKQRMWQLVWEWLPVNWFTDNNNQPSLFCMCIFHLWTYLIVGTSYRLAILNVKLQLLSYFSVFKLSFTLRALASTCSCSWIFKYIPCKAVEEKNQN